MTLNTSDRIAVVTVHGTGDTALGPDGPKWFQRGSGFAGRLEQRLAGEGVAADIHPHLWSGTNSATAREKAAESLKKTVRRLARSYAGVHVIGHSHGGNVANDAACMLNWSSKQRRAALSSVTTVGTPFFRTLVTAGERVGAWTFIVVTALSIVSILLTLFLLPVREDSAAWAGRVSAAIIISAAAILFFMFLIAFRGVGRIRRASRRRRDDKTVFAIWHPADEAIGFLRSIESLELEPFPRWSLLRGSRTGAIVWGVRVVVLIPLLVVAISLVGSGSYKTGDASNSTEYYLNLVTYLLYGFALAPFIFGLIYFIYRMFAFIFELLARRRLNKVIGGALKGMAFGRDGDNRIGEVSPVSHYYSARRLILDGDLAQRMTDAATASAQRLFDKYRGGFFNAEADQSEILKNIAADALTWDSLVHTTYFDQPEIADFIADNIARVALNREVNSSPAEGDGDHSPVRHPVIQR